MWAWEPFWGPPKRGTGVFYFTSPGSGFSPGQETGWLVGWLVGSLVRWFVGWLVSWAAASPASPASLGLGLPVGFDLLAIQSYCGLVSGDCWVVGLSEVLYKEGGSWVCLGVHLGFVKG